MALIQFGGIRRWSFAYIVQLLFACVTVQAGAQTPAYKLHGFDFSPYVDGQNPNLGSHVSLAQVQLRLALVGPYTEWIRSFSSTHGNEYIPPVAKSMNLKVAAGAWIGRDLSANATEIAGLISSAQAGAVDLAIVGSEALLRNDVSEQQLIAYIDQVKQALPANVPVATADTFDVLLAHPNVIAAVDVVLPNIYPYWMGMSLPNAVCTLESAYDQVVAAAGGKPVIISETGWPDGGNDIGAAVPSPENASTFFLQFVSWARGRNVQFFYFEALDETWKANVEGPQGAHWGTFDKSGVLKPGMQAVFDGQTVPVTCDGIPGGPGTPDLQFTYVPPYSAGAPRDALQGLALHIPTSDYRVVVYIFVPGFGWVVKPTLGTPLSTIHSDGTWSADVVTGGSDASATQIAGFLIPVTYSPPLLFGAGSLPPELFTESAAQVQVTRSVNSVSGLVTDPSGHVVSGSTLTLTGSNDLQTTTAPDGRYSFFNLTGSGPDVLTPSAANVVFAPTSVAIPGISGNVVADFIASATADISIESTASTPVPPGSHVAVTIVAGNAGPATASDVVVNIAPTGTITQLSATTTAGNCAVNVSVSCQVGNLSRSAFATITVGLTVVSGSVAFTANVSASQPDTNAANNSAALLVATVSPTVVTGTASAVSATRAALSATVNPNGTNTIVQFTYGPDLSYGRQTTASPVGAGTSPIPVNATVSGLACDTVYHAQAVGTNGNTVGGGDVTFVTSACPPFADSTLVPGGTSVRATHILELRSRIDRVRIQKGLGPYFWTDPDLTATVIVIKAAHINELRTALLEAYGVPPAPALPFFTDVISSGGVVKAIHILELRTAVLAIE